MDHMNLERRMPPLENIDHADVKVEFKPFDKKLVSSPDHHLPTKMMSPPDHHQRINTWPRPENFEDEQRAKNALNDPPAAVSMREFMDPITAATEDERFNGQSGGHPFGGGGGGNGEGGTTPLQHHGYSPDQMMHGEVGHLAEGGGPGGPGGQNGSSQTNNAKKTSSRRNAWGNLSYADLITQAIQTNPEKRLTLSQVYDWMVQNIPYFKDKGDSNSSAGWKVC